MNPELPSEITLLVDRQGVVLAAFYVQVASNGAPSQISLVPQPDQRLQTIAATNDTMVMLSKLTETDHLQRVFRDGRLDLIPGNFSSTSGRT